MRADLQELRREINRKVIAGAKAKEELEKAEKLMDQSQEIDNIISTPLINKFKMTHPTRDITVYLESSEAQSIAERLDADAMILLNKAKAILEEGNN